MKTDHCIMLAAALIAGAFYWHDMDLWGTVVWCIAGIYIMRDNFKSQD